MGYSSRSRRGTDDIRDYVAVAVKFVKTFDSTAHDPEKYGESKDLSDFFGNNFYKLPLELTNAESKASILREYDGVLMISSEHTGLTQKGDRSLILTMHYCFGSSYSYYEENNLVEGVSAMTPMVCYYDREGEPDILPFIDEKVVLEEHVLIEHGAGKYSSLTASYIEESNRYLTELGLTDNLFKDGMMVEELEEYFELVTDSDTFAPLFEDR